MVKKTNLKNIKENISELSKKPELWIGVVTILVIAVVSGSFILNKLKKSTLTKNSENHELSLDIDKEKEESITDITKTTNEKATITKLADTKGVYIVQNGDNYWKISEKVCGNGKYFESISAENNFITLHAGDIITVNCR